MSSKTLISSGLAVIGILLIGGIALYSNNGAVTMQTGTDTTTTVPATTDTPSGTVTTTTPTSPYKDGTYTASGNYVSPGGKQAVSVTVTLKDGVIADISMTPGAIDEDSMKFQKRFISGIKQQVVGKSIDALNVGVVSGSSLTVGGFTDAITTIKAQARA